MSNPAIINVVANTNLATALASLEVVATQVAPAQITILADEIAPPVNPRGRLLSMGNIAVQWECEEDPELFEFASARLSGETEGEKQPLAHSSQPGHLRSGVIVVAPGLQRLYIRSVNFLGDTSDWEAIGRVESNLPLPMNVEIRGLEGARILEGATFYAAHPQTQRMIGVQFPQEINL